jgi:hypothetical protein
MARTRTKRPKLKTMLDAGTIQDRHRQRQRVEILIPVPPAVPPAPSLQATVVPTTRPTPTQHERGIRDAKYAYVNWHKDGRISLRIYAPDDTWTDQEFDYKYKGLHFHEADMVYVWLDPLEIRPEGSLLFNEADEVVELMAWDIRQRLDSEPPPTPQEWMANALRGYVATKEEAWELSGKLIASPDDEL